MLFGVAGELNQGPSRVSKKNRGGVGVYEWKKKNRKKNNNSVEPSMDKREPHDEKNADPENLTDFCGRRDVRIGRGSF